MSNKYSEYKRFLNRRLRGKALISSELVAILSKRYNVKESNARQIIYSLKGEGFLYCIENLNFNANQKAYSLIDDKSLYRTCLNKHKKYLDIILNKMELEGYISKFEVGKISGCLFDNSERHLTLGKVLREIRIFIQFESKTYNDAEFYVDTNKIAIFHENIKARDTAEQINSKFLGECIKFLKNNNFIENSFTLRRYNRYPLKEITFNKICFDAQAFTKSVGLTEGFTDRTKTIALFDIELVYGYGIDRFNSFKNRVEIIRNSVISKKRKVLPIVIYNQNLMSKEALREIKKLNYIAFEIKSLFGDNVVNIIELMKSLFYENLNDTNKIEEALNYINISGQNGNLGNIKGSFFEMVCYNIFQKLFEDDGLEDISFNEKIRHNGKDAEIDIILKVRGETILIECKAYNTQITLGDERNADGTFRRHVEKNVLLFSQKYRITDYKICYVSRNGFYQNVHNVLPDYASKKSNYLELTYDSDSLISLANTKRQKLEAEISIIEEYFEKTERSV